MKRIYLAFGILALIWGTTQVKADIILSDFVFADLGSTGFGNAPRLLTLQQNTLESGGTVATAGGGTQFFFGGIPTVPQTTCTNNGNCGVAGGGTRTGTNESLVYSVGALGWISGAEVGIGLDTNQSLGGQSAPLTFQTLVLTLYDVNGVALGSFAGNAPVDISGALLDQQQGNGNSVFNLQLTLAEQAEFDSILTGQGCTIGVACGNVFEGLRASFGCGAFGPAVCNTPGNFSSTDGAESFLAFAQSAAVPGPVAGAGLPGLMSLGLLWFARRRQKRQQLA